MSDVDPEATAEFCIVCRYAQVYPTDHVKFLCRRYPPRPVHNPERIPAPMVDAYDWCGEFQRGTPAPAELPTTLPTPTGNRRR
jgi:hypothetical protein